MRALHILFFVLLGLYIISIVFVGLPAIHSMHDPLIIRDTGTIWSSLSWNIKEDQQYSVPVAVLCHSEGALQFLFLNAYCHLVGNLFPLDPVTMQVPHALLTFLCSICFFLLGKKVHSDKFGYLCAVMFVVSPWVAFTIRKPEIYHLFSLLFELLLFYFYLSYLEEPERKWYRIAAPLTLALYLTGALDWPSFLFIFFLFLVLHKNKVIGVLKNPYNCLPLLVIGVYLVFSVIFFLNELPYTPFEPFLKPIEKVLFTRQTGSWTHSSFSVANILSFAFRAFGIEIILSLIGVGSFFLLKKQSLYHKTGKSASQKYFFTAMGIWLLLFSFPLFATLSGISPEQSQFFLAYSYVIGIPVVIFSALLLSKDSKGFLTVGVVCVMVWSQWNTIITTTRPFPFRDTDRRIVAAADFLIEQRPDLLEPGKIAFLPGEHAKGIGQYARGQNWLAATHPNFPKFLVEDLQKGNKNLMKYPAGQLLLPYITQKKLTMNWLVLTPELLLPSPENQSFGFYRQLAADPQISWIACFQDAQNRKVWIGEVASEGFPIEKAPMYDVEPLADMYQQKYNRINFLKRNGRYILHY